MMDLSQHLRLNFDASEWLALLELAKKNRVDVGTILRIGAIVVLDADRRGQFKMVAKNPGLIRIPKGGLDS